MDVGYLLLFLVSAIVIVAWLTIDDDDFNERFERYRNSTFEDEES